MARENFQSFIKFIEVPGAPLNDSDECEEFYPETITPARHHRLLCDVLQLVAEGELRRVMIFLPPGSAKSTYASVCFPPWFMGRKPRSNIITLSYGADLARKFGRRCRSIVRSSQYEEIFETRLSQDSAAADGWELTSGSTYMANGLIAGVTGNRADGLVIDDPVRGIKDADSEAFQKSTYEAYIFDARTRLKPNGWQLIIQTRWHPNDLSGMLLPESYDGRSGVVSCRDGHDWFVLSIPYECERDDDPIGRKPGELLWSEYLNSGDILAIKNNAADERTWAALYQQRPTLGSGSYFKVDWLRSYDERPTYLRTYGASDYAVTADGGDYTVHLVVGVDPEDNIYILDVWREQKSPDVTTDAFIDLCQIYKPLAWAVDKDLMTKSLGPFVRKRMEERNVYTVVTEMALGRQDKAMRAQAIRGRTAMGKVYLPASAPWVNALKAEMLAFPVAKHDDQVDCLGLIGRLLDEMISASVPKPSVDPETTDYRSKKKPQGNSWMTA